MAKAAKNGKVNRQILPPTTNPLGVKSVYANNLEFRLSPFDARLEFNEVIVDQGGVSVEKRAVVVMSLGHFKTMMKVLNDQAPAVEQAEAQVSKALAPAEKKSE